MNKITEKHFKSLDSLYIACAIVFGCDYFITGDRGIIKIGGLPE